MFVVGIVSRGVECFSAGLFTSVFHWRDWIKQVSGVDAVNPTGGGGGGSQPGGEPDGGLKWYYYLLIAIGVLGLVVTLLVCFRAQAGKGNSAPVPQPVTFSFLPHPGKMYGDAGFYWELLILSSPTVSYSLNSSVPALACFPHFPPN